MNMSEFDELLGELKRTRDELALQLQLASMEAKKEWQELEGRWKDFSARADIDETAEGIGAALKQLGAELKTGYAKFRDALRE
jgi:hypothetical protein